MKIENKNDGKSGMFYIESNGEIIAKMTYRLNENLIKIDHTEISSQLAGKGIGKKILFEAVKFARENNIKVKPVCDFAKSVFEKEPAYDDVYYRNIQDNSQY